MNPHTNTLDQNGWVVMVLIVVPHLGGEIGQEWEEQAAKFLLIAQGVVVAVGDNRQTL